MMDNGIHGVVCHNRNSLANESHCSGNWPARTQKLQSYDCPCDCQSIVLRKIYISVYMISARALSLT